MPAHAFKGPGGLLAAIALASMVGACSVLEPLDGLTGAGGDGGGADTGDADVTGDGDGGVRTGTGDAGGGPGVDGAAPEGDSGTMDSAATDSGTLDSAGPSHDGSSAPGPDSGAPRDASTGDDAQGGIDAAPEVGPPVGYCAGLSPAPLFCDDFDEGALATPWDQLPMTDGQATLSTTYAVSAPDAMLCQVNANAPAASVEVAAYKSFSANQGVAGTYTMSFDMRVDTADQSAASDAVLAAIQLWNGPTSMWDLELEVSYAPATSDLSASLTEDSTTDYASHAASTHIAMKTWTRISLAITLPAGSGGATPATMTFGGTPVVAAQVKVTTSNPIPEIVVGPTYASPAASGWSVRFDNVTFD